MLARRSLPSLSVVVGLVAGSIGAPASAVTAPPTCFGERATLVGSGVLRGTPGPDVIVATSTTSEVRAGRGADRICGSPMVYGGPGADWIRYGRDDGGDVELMGQEGADLVVVTSPAFAFLYGGQGPDVLKSRGGEQWLLGEGGRDQIWAGRGPDHLLGGRSVDSARGGEGWDDCEAERRRDCEAR